MAGTASVAGGTHTVVSKLSSHEHAIVKNALAKLGLSSASSSHLSGWNDSIVVGSGNATLLGASGAPTTSDAGKETAGSHTLSNDTLVAGSAHQIIQTSLGRSNTADTSKTVQPSGDTINVAGHTAASFHATPHAKPHGAASTTIKLAEKTSVTLVGIKHPTSTKH